MYMRHICLTNREGHESHSLRRHRPFSKDGEGFTRKASGLRPKRPAMATERPRERRSGEYRSGQDRQAFTIACRTDGRPSPFRERGAAFLHKRGLRGDKSQDKRQERRKEWHRYEADVCCLGSLLCTCHPGVAPVSTKISHFPTEPPT